MGSKTLISVEEKLRPGTDLKYQRGYIDVLGENPRADLGREQSVFRSRLLPPIYERFWRPIFARMLFGRGLREEEERRMTLELLSISPGDSVLDVGCGTGNYTRHLTRAAGDGVVVGIDASRSMVSTAARRGGGENLSYLRGDACALPFADGEFDRVCSIGVIHILNEPLVAVSEMVRVLASGGRLVMMASCEENAVPGGRSRMIAFGKDELTGALEVEGLTDIEQRVVRRGQFVAGRKPR